MRFHARGCPAGNDELRLLPAFRVAALLAVVALPCAARTLHPDASATPGAQVSGSALDLTRGGLRIRVEPLTPPQVADWFRTRTRSGQMALPLDGAATEPTGAPGVGGAAPGPGNPPPQRRKPPAPLTVFAVSIENLTGEDVAFVPEMASLVGDHDEERAPIPSDVLRSALRAAFAATSDPDAGADDAMNAVHSDSLLLKPTQRASRLLIFPPTPPGKRATLVLHHVEVGQHDVEPYFSFIVGD